MTNHINSPKHKIYLKIANTAMARINKNMNQNICISKCRSSLYFCDICVVAVEDKMGHISSNYHRIAVKKEKLFNSLVEMYVNDSNLNFDCDINYDESNETENYEKENGESIATENESSDDEISDTFKEIDDNKTREVFNSIEQEVTDYQLKILNARTTNSHVLKSFDRNNYIIETKDGVQIKVDRNSYHGFKKIGKRKYMCQLCSHFCQRKGNHILMEKHLKNISSIIGYHCIREVDTSTTHCIICNEIIESYLLHTMCNEKHIELLKNSIIHSDDPDVNESESKISIDNTIHENEPNKSDGSHKIVDVGSQKLKANEVKDKLPSQNPVEHLKENVNTNLSQLNKTNEINESKELKNIVPTNVSTNQNAELIVSKTTSLIHPDLYMIKTTKQGKSCYFCEVPIPNTTRNIIEHLNGSKHKQTVTVILNHNGLIVRNGHIYCKYCENNMIKEYQYFHMQLESHKENIANDKVIDVKESNIDEINTLNDKEDSIQETNNGTNFEEIEFPSIMEKTPRGNEITCKICNVIVPYKKSNIQEHLEGNKHKNNLIDLLDKNKIIIKDSRNFCELCSFNIQDDMNFEHIITYFHMRKLEIHENENNYDVIFKRMKIIFTYILNILENGNLLCTVCNISIPNKESNITEHIKGKKHISIENEIFKKNKLTNKDVNSYCEICSLYIYNGLEHGHINTKLHEGNMNRTSFKIDNIDQIPKSTNFTEHIGIVQSTPHVVRCTICNVDVPDSLQTLNMHVQGTKHKSKLKTFLNQ